MTSKIIVVEILLEVEQLVPTKSYLDVFNQAQGTAVLTS